jgi:hypothetical protein
VSPDFFANKFGCFASQHVHLQTDFDIPDVEFSVPFIIPPKITL